MTLIGFGFLLLDLPLDVRQCSPALNEDGFSKRIYGDRLLKSLQNRLLAQYDICDFAFEREEVDQCQSIMDIENLLIAPTFGFDDAWDYYDKTKTIDRLDQICVPQFVLMALDDPFLMVEPSFH